MTPGCSETAVTVSGAPKARWIRLEIGGNHGHPTLTELAEVRGVGSGVLAVSVVSLDTKKFKLVEVAAC